MRPPLALLRCTILAIVCAGPCAQTIHFVGPGGFSQIQPAITAASVGDTIVVHSGVYRHFVLNKGLTLTAAPGALVQVASQQIAGVATVVTLPVGQRAHVAGIQFRNLAPFAFAMDIRVVASTVDFVDCIFESAAWAGQPGLVVQNSNVVMHRFWVFGGGSISNAPSGQGGAGSDGLYLFQSTLAATDSVFVGGNLHWDFINGAGDGIEVDASNLHLSHCVAIGGYAGLAFPVESAPPLGGVVR